MNIYLYSLATAQTGLKMNRLSWEAVCFNLHEGILNGFYYETTRISKNKYVIGTYIKLFCKIRLKSGTEWTRTEAIKALVPPINHE